MLCNLSKYTILEGRNGLIIAKCELYIVCVYVYVFVQCQVHCVFRSQTKLVQISCFWWPYAFGDTKSMRKLLFTDRAGWGGLSLSFDRRQNHQTNKHAEGWIIHFDSFIMFCCIHMYDVWLLNQIKKDEKWKKLFKTTFFHSNDLQLCYCARFARRKPVWKNRHFLKKIRRKIYTIW